MLDSRLLKFWLAVIFPIIIFWLILYSLGYPPPYPDDLFFTGAAINLAKGGDFVNPLLAQWSEQTAERFFVQPPFHSYVLAAWLSLAGINTQSLLFFQCLCYITFSIFTALILRRYRIPSGGIYAVILCFAAWMFNVGFRQDTLGMVFLAIGLWFLTRDRPLSYFWGFCFLGSYLLTTPLAIVYAPVLGLSILWANGQGYNGNLKKYLLPRFGVLLLAIATTFFLFLWAVNFQPGQFFADLSWHASLRRSSIFQAISGALWTLQVGYGEIIYGSVLCLFMVLLILLFWQWRSNTKLLKSMVLSLSLCLIFNILAYSNSVTGIFLFFLWLTIIIILAKIQIKPILKKVLIGITFFIFLINNSLIFVTLAGSHTTPTSQYQEARDLVNENPQQQYLIDEVTARFVFDYQLPENSIDWNFSNKAPEFWRVSFPNKSNDSIWIISAAKAWHEPELPNYPKLKILGRRFESIPKYPHHIIIIN